MLTVLYIFPCAHSRTQEQSIDARFGCKIIIFSPSKCVCVYNVIGHRHRKCERHHSWISYMCAYRANVWRHCENKQI